tara:strand:- start:32 stop:565 length:534 start_codon:yes stop_codon:yes gene_type:complete
MWNVIDNFLDDEIFKEIQQVILGEQFPWRFNEYILSPELDGHRRVFQFTHSLYKEYNPSSKLCSIIDPVLEIIRPIAIYRIKANLRTRTTNIEESKPYHVDFADFGNNQEKLKQWTTSVLYMNTNNGYTKFEDGSIVESVANRFLTFESDMLHCGTSCTDENKRVIINFNYFSKYSL